MLLDCKGTNVIKQKQKQMFLDHVFTQQLNSSFKKTHEDSNNKIQNPKSKIQNPKSKKQQLSSISNPNFHLLENPKRRYQQSKIKKLYQ